MRRSCCKQWARNIEKKLNTYRIQKKLVLLYIFCVLLPLVLTDSVIVGMVFHEEKNARQQVTENIAGAVAYTLDKTVDEALSLSKNIYMNTYINDFLNADYASQLDYYEAYLQLMQDSLFDSSLGTSSVMITMYADNETIVNGGKFRQLGDARGEAWYQVLEESGKDMIFFSYLDQSHNTSPDAVRKASVIRRLNYYKRDPYEKVLKIDLDYNAVNLGLLRANYDSMVYVCRGKQIIFSNDGRNNIKEPFTVLSGQIRRRSYVQKKELYGEKLEIYVVYPQVHFKAVIMHNAGLILLLVLINALLPVVFMRFLNRSFTARLRLLQETFDCENTEHLKTVEHIEGTDEISQLMHNYNLMAERMNNLILTVYKSRLNQQESEIARQEADIARQKAELLALHSQINPHFLFNVLENIRMRSILKHEDETADMIEQLSVMERQYVEWGTDIVSLEEETGFVEAYLKLQKYRFGDRLTYRIELDEACKRYRIPKLSLVTFMENSCVHGIEDKAAPCWVFVRIYRDEENLYLEVEDTGNGMPAEYLAYLRERMEQADIEMLKEKGRVGVVNACLRLKMYTKHQVKFSIESEKGVGTVVSVSIPLFSIGAGEKKGDLC